MSNAAENPFQAPQARVMDHAEATVQPRVLTIAGRINRIRYLAYSMATLLLAMVAIGILAAVTLPNAPALGMVLVGVGYLLVIVLQFMLTIQRCHDFNTTGWLSLLIIVPFGVLLFWFVPGTASENRFGLPNPPNTVLSYLGAFLLPFVFIGIIGMLAAVSIPAYNDYTKRAKAAQLRQAAPPPIEQPARQD